jgi:hypothetical protein
VVALGALVALLLPRGKAAVAASAGSQPVHELIAEPIAA